MKQDACLGYQMLDLKVLKLHSMFEPYRHSYGIFLMTFSDCKVTRPHWLFRHAPITSIIRDLRVYYKWLLKSLLKHNRFRRKPLLDNRKPFNATSQSESMLEIEIGRSTCILKFGILSNLTRNWVPTQARCTRLLFDWQHNYPTKNKVWEHNIP